jgi:hypothetical protein
LDGGRGLTWDFCSCASILLGEPILTERQVPDTISPLVRNSNRFNRIHLRPSLWAAFLLSYKPPVYPVSTFKAKRCENVSDIIKCHLRKEVTFI